MSLRVAMISVHTSPGAAPGAGDVGGMNVVIRQLSRELARLGSAVEILTRRTDPEAPASIELDPGVRLRHLDAGPAEVLPKSAHEALVPEFAKALGALPAYDLVHAHHWYSGVAAQAAAAAWGAPLVQSLHSIAAAPHTPLSAGERPESPGRLAAEEALASQADALHAVSAAERDIIVDRLGASRGRVTVIPPGVDTRQFHPGRAARPGADYLLMAARLEPLKGADLAIETLARIDPALVGELIISGGATSGFDDYVAGLHQLVADRGVAERVRFVGARDRDELARLMAGARLFLNPSHSETYGLTVLEASASGVPVVAAAAGGLVEAVRHGETGLVLHHRDPQLWADAVTGLLRDPAEARRVAEGGLVHARRHTWALMAERTLAAYRGLLQRS
ncbi:glycosyltransferase [Ruania zhangjianzhongii]|uniref:glycosyltransferase n=1 Tax=Ruania zhangjianzhongii TaxID=2603206 RepID=UPI0011CC79CE|nr:glycosyltransferase [Ruania zhangjianzhongii]